MGTITVANLGKAYKQYPTRWSRMREWLSPRKRQHHQLNWVLQDINFNVQPGEAVGIIGINGAGKSTLLKLITGTTQPTTGSVQMTGRVAAMLELGMGFHPDFTGRQNAFMASQLLGYSKVDIAKLMPEIIAFSEVGDYIDQPVRVYSSGMQMRLAFSVATARRPDVLIVDEALSVGDVYFQHKSFDRIREFRKQGTTLLIVSHDKDAIQSICDRAILLNAGKISTQGTPESVMDYYNSMLSERENLTIRKQTTVEGICQTISGTGEATVVDIALLNEQGERMKVIEVSTPVILEIKVEVHRPIPRLVLGYVIKDRLGLYVFGTNTHHLERPKFDLTTGTELIYRFKFQANLGPGNYSIATALVSTDTHLANNYEWRDLALLFSVSNFSKYTFVGTNWMPPTLEVSQQ
jgi:lipopolysaccharide transport system ATP-binding protein